MYPALKAIIFDMDGVIIESEHLWRRAMIQVFEEYGMPLSEQDCRKTTGLRIGEVIEIWLAHFKQLKSTAKEIEAGILNMLVTLIEQTGTFIEGIPELLTFAREKKLKIGLATSSSEHLMRTVLKKLNIENQIEVAVSAEFMTYGKPHPEVFLTCAQKLNVKPQECLVIEDSLNGVIAAKAAQMRVIAVPDDEHKHKKEFAVADYQISDMHHVLTLIKTLLPRE